MRTLRLSLVGAIILVSLGGLGSAVVAQMDEDADAVYITQVSTEPGEGRASSVAETETLYSSRDGLDHRSTDEWSDPRASGTWTNSFNVDVDPDTVLALHVYPENDFGPYRSLWHRDPAGSWSIYVDGARLDTACPRYFGVACERTDFTHIELTWTGPRSLQVVMDAPSLRWTLTASENAALRLLNPISAILPLATWRPALSSAPASCSPAPWAWATCVSRAPCPAVMWGP